MQNFYTQRTPWYALALCLFFASALNTAHAQIDSIGIEVVNDNLLEISVLSHCPQACIENTMYTDLSPDGRTFTVQYARCYGLLTVVEPHEDNFTIPAPPPGPFTVVTIVNSAWVDWNTGDCSWWNPSSSEQTESIELPEPPPSVGLEESPMQASELRIYPNPANAIVNVRLNNEAEIVQLNVISALGQTALQQRTSGSNVQLDVSQLAPGHYLLQATDASGQQHLQRLVRTPN